MKPMILRRVFLGSAVAGLVRAGNWPRFRGLDGAGLAVGQGALPERLEKPVWTAETPAGHSSPIVWEDRIFLTGADGGSRADAGLNKVVDTGGKLSTLCLSRKDGRLMWQREVPRPRLERYQPTNSPASPSVVTDGRTVYAFFGDFGLLAYSMEGKEVWRHALGPFNNINGHGSSPMLAGNLLIMQCDQDTNSYLLAVDKRTGKTAWKVERPEVTRSYSTPVLYEPAGGRKEVIVPGSYYVTGYDALTGERLWWVRGMSWQTKSAAVLAGGMVYVHGWEAGGEAEQPSETLSWAEAREKFDANKDGRITQAELAVDERLARGLVNNDLNYDGGLTENEWENYRARRASRNTLMAIKPGGRGDVTESHLVWRMQKFLPNVPSPLVYDGIMYLIKDGGILSAVDAATGKIFKQGRIEGALDTYYSSPVGGDGKVYLVSQPGKATVLKAGAQWEVLSQTDLEDECYATPALVDGSVYLRTRSAVRCYAPVK